MLDIKQYNKNECFHMTNALRGLTEGARSIFTHGVVTGGRGRVAGARKS